MRKSRVGVVVGIVAAAAVVGGVTAIATTAIATTATPTATQETVIHQMTADYPAFGTAADLAKASALVVRATAVEIGSAYHDVPAGLDTSKLPAHKAEQVGPVQHDVVFRVDDVLRGNATTGATVKVIQLGGQIDVDRYVAEAEPLSVKGGSYLLFLVPLQGGRFGIVGGPQGRYLIENGKLKALDQETASRGVASQLQGLNVTAIGSRLGG